MKRNRSRNKAPGNPQLSPTKRWIFRLISIFLLPAILFGMLEAGLRLSRYGYPSDAFLKGIFNGRRLVFPNTQFTRRFFPAGIARSFHEGLVFEEEKPPGTYRIFILGGSAAEGTPEPLYNFGRLLEAMLDETYPQVRFEVHNAAIVAINSHVVREIAEDCLEFDPDLLVVYLGNNEVVGPYGPGTVLTSTPATMPMIRASMAFKSFRTGQLYEEILGRLTSRRQGPRSWGGMSMFLDRQVEADSTALAAAYGHFEENLREICRMVERSDTELILCNVGVNLKDCAPFGSSHGQALSRELLATWEAYYREGIAAEEAAEYSRAVEHYLEAAQLDPAFAELQFRLGRCLWEVGDFETARRCFEDALGYDTLRFRADSQINEIIQSVAAGRESDGIHFVDSVSAFEQESAHQVPGGECFYEHVHLNFQGNYVLARSILSTIRQLLPEGASSAGSALPTLEELAQAIAYTPCKEHDDLFTMYNDYMDRPPFTQQLYHEETMTGMKSELERMEESIDRGACLRQIDAALVDRPDDWRLLLNRYNTSVEVAGIQDLGMRSQEIRRIIGLHPYTPAFTILGKMLMEQRRLDEAEAVYQQLLEIDPYSAPTYYSLAETAFQKRDFKSVIRQTLRGLKIDDPQTIAPYGLLANAYDSLGKTGHAIRYLEAATGSFDGAQEGMLHYHLGTLYEKKKNWSAAQKHMDRALQLYPALGQQDAFRNRYAIIQARQK